MRVAFVDNQIHHADVLISSRVQSLERLLPLRIVQCVLLSHDAIVLLLQIDIHFQPKDSPTLAVTTQ
jgi:hypothetical protein